MGNSATAYPQGSDAIHYNPAGLALVKQSFEQYKLQGGFFEHSGSVSGSAPGRSYHPIAGFEDDPLLQGKQTRSVSVDSPSVYLPFFDHVTLPFLLAPGHGFVNRTEDGGFTYGNSMFALQVFGYKRDKDNIAAFNGQQFGITRIAYFNPSIGFELVDDLYIGASVGFSWQGLGITTRTRSVVSSIANLAGLVDGLGQLLGPDALGDLGSLSPYNDVGTLQLELEDPLSLAFTVGLLWQPTPWLSFGATYQSQGESELEGDFNIEYTSGYQRLMQTLQPADGLLTTVADGGSIAAKARQSGKVTADYTQPQWASLGVSALLTPSLRANLDIKWVDYSVLEEIRFKFDSNIDYLVLASVVNQLAEAGYGKLGGDFADPDEMRLQRQYQAVVDWSVGIEYQHNDNIKLRAGYEPRSSSIPEDRQDLLIPIGEATLYTIGIGYRCDRNTDIDFAFGYMSSQIKIQPGESRNANSSLEGDVVYNPYRDLKIDHKITAYIFTLAYSTHF
ncbi:MAG: outer membrane protein transport protein [Pseudomonadales bacterium]|nr:outer membrane protein transport protein [Pseudomonadales bacterium]